MIIAGVDASLSSTGIAIVNTETKEVLYLGKITTSVKKVTPDESARLKQIFNEFQSLMTFYKPDTIIMENQHIGRNVKTGMGLSRVRGVIQLASAVMSIPFSTIEPTQIKMLVTGKGNAKKEVVQESIVQLYANQAAVQKSLPKIVLSGKDKTDDMADALAIAHTYSVDPSIAVTA